MRTTSGGGAGRMALAALGALVALGLPPTTPAAAQSAATRTPNLAGAWTAAPGVIQFNFVHRFQMSDPPLRKVTNTPTFLVATGITDHLAAGFVYGPNSALVPLYPNEWEIFGRASPVRQDAGAPLDVAAQVGWNTASESVDTEISLARRAGPVRVFAAGRWFSRAFDREESRAALAAGASLRLSRWIALAGDYGALLDREDGERPAWGAGVQLGVPYTPHSMSIHATNVGTASLEGNSRGTRTRWGFEYTVPITVRRYAPPAGDAAPSAPAAAARMAPAAPMTPAGTDTVHVTMEGLKYSTDVLEVAPGTTVVWTNADPVAHTVTADDGSFDSDLIEPGGSWSRTFGAGEGGSYHCTPHPFMKATITVVASAMDGGGS